MQRLDLYEFVDLGEALRSARTVTNNDSIFDAYTKTFWLKDKLEILISKDLFELGIVRHDCQKLIDVLDEIDNRTWDENVDSKTKISSTFLDSKLKNAITSFTSVMAAECRQASVYNVSKVAIFSTSSLVEAARNAFPAEILEKLPEEAKCEYESSAKCLAFRLSTAAGFHMMRAVEFALVPYVRTFSGRDFKSLNTNWGSYIAHLEKIECSGKRKKPKKETIDLLRQLKNNHRNPVMHADLTLSDQEALEIFYTGGVVISAISREM